MMDILKNCKSLVKIEQIRTDNNVFRLHYKLTVIILIVCSILLTSKQYFGEPIKCHVDKSKTDIRDAIEVFCWIHGTFIKNPLLPNIDGATRGLGNAHQIFIPFEDSTDGVVFQKYYQWVCIIFCFQALLFYFPRFLWKAWEGGRLRYLINDLDTPLVTEAWNGTTKAQIIQYLLNGKCFHNLYATKYVICEILNLINVILQIFFTNWFLGGKFTYYGWEVATAEKIDTPMNNVFPKLTKCSYNYYGPSGGRVDVDALCILPLNVLNEKLYLVLWFWLYFLASVTILSLVYRIGVVFSPKLRVYLLMAQARFIAKRQATAIINKLSYGDFFVLYHVGKNVNPIIFRDLVLGVHEALKAKHPYGAYPGMEINSI